MKFKIKVEMELELQGGMVFERQKDVKRKYLLIQESEDEYKWIDLEEYCAWGVGQSLKETAEDIKYCDMVYLGMMSDLMK